MKIRTLAVAAGVSTPLILGGSASGGFVGITTTSKPNAFGLLTVIVYAEFDRPGEDHMVAVAGKPAVELNITVIGGTFYNHPLSGDQAPHHHLLAAFPSLAYDTFVTIGVKCVGDPPCQPVDTLTITPGFPTGITGSTLAGRFGWAITPAAPQGDPFNTRFSFPGNGKIVIGQYSTADGGAISGTMLIQSVSNGVSGLAIVSFCHVPTPGALAVMGGSGLFGARRRRR